MARSLRMVGRGALATAIALALSFGVAQSVSAATRQQAVAPKASCIEGDCTVYCQSIGFTNGFCPAAGRHCICS